MYGSHYESSHDRNNERMIVPLVVSRGFHNVILKTPYKYLNKHQDDLLNSYYMQNFISKKIIKYRFKNESEIRNASSDEHLMRNTHCYLATPDALVNGKTWQNLF